MTPRSAFLSVLIITLLVYMQTLTFDFAGLDDQLLLTANPVAHGLTIHNVVTAFTSYDPELYIPLTLLSYQVEYTLAGGLYPFIFHQTNVILHLIASMLVFLVTKRLANAFTEDTLASWVGVACCAVFALHPLNTQAVAWIAARKDLLSGVFALLSILFFLRARQDDNATSPYLLSVITFLFGLLAKVSIIGLPIVLFLIDSVVSHSSIKQRLQRITPHLVASVVLGLVALGGKTDQLKVLNLWDSLLLGSKSVLFYLEKTVAPVKLALYYPHGFTIDIADPLFLFAIFACALLLILMLASFFVLKRPWITLGIAWFFIFLAPSWLNFYKNGFIDLASDRYMYLAIIGVIFPVAMVVVPRLKQPDAVLGTLAIILAGSSWLHTRAWASSTSILEDTLRHYPESTHAIVNLGTTMYQNGDTAGAIRNYERAIKLNPNLPIAYLNIARIRYKDGQLAEALNWGEQAVNAIPADRPPIADDIQAYFFLGTLYDEYGRPSEAITLFEQAAERAPYAAVTHLNLGIMHQKYSHYSDALRAYQAVLEREPRNIEAHYRLATVALELGRLSLAKEHLETVLSMNPQYEDAAQIYDTL